MLFSCCPAMFRIGDEAYNLMESLCRTETCRARTDDEDVDRAVDCQ